MRLALSSTLLALALAATTVTLAQDAPPASASANPQSKPAAEPSRYGKQKVVYHFNTYDAKAQADGLRNVQNHINAVGAENIELRIVMHGDGVSMLLYPDAVNHTKMKEGNATEEMQSRIAALKGQGVKLDICANTLKGRDVKPEDLYDVSDADIVPSGVAELSRLQAMGYTYIKP